LTDPETFYTIFTILNPGEKEAPQVMSEVNRSAALFAMMMRSDPPEAGGA
jgi:hypothetical protein